MFQAVEGAEDDPDAGAAAMLEADVTARDTVVGISASGTGPVCAGRIEASREARRDPR